MTFVTQPLPFFQLIEDANTASLRDTVHLLPLWFWETNADYVVTYVSGNFERANGFKAEELIGVRIVNPVYGRGESEAGMGEYHAALLRREPIESFSYERIAVNGERIVLLDSALPQFDSQGNFTGYCGVSFHMSKAMEIASDSGSLIGSLSSRTQELEEALSQRKEQLEGSNRLLAEVLDALGEGLVVTSGADSETEGNIVQFFNPAFRRIMNIGAQEVYPGMSTIELGRVLVDHGDLTQEALEQISKDVRDGKTVSIDIKSNQISVEIKGIPRPDGGMVLVHKDVTRLRARTAMLEKAKRDAETATQAKSNFLASMSHEIRTPMNGIIGVADLLSATDLNEEQAELVETINRSASALTSLIGDILELSKIEAGHLALTSEPFNLHDLIEDMRRMMSPMAQLKGVHFNLDLDPNLGLYAIGDKQRLRQVLINLLGNAVKFTSKGSVCLCVERSGTEDVVMTVRDTGVGIPEENIADIFNSFERVPGGLRGEFEGTGLGLAITKELVEAMNGQVSVTSQEGLGSNFKVVLPMSQAAPIEEQKKKPHGPQKTDFSAYRVLLAEDNLTNQLVARKMLERLGISPDIVNNGQEACEAFEQQSYDVVLMDISMPVMTGLDAARQIRAFEKDQDRAPSVIIALTGNAFDSDRANSVDAGMDGFLTKPMRLNDLKSCFQTVLCVAHEDGETPKVI